MATTDSKAAFAAGCNRLALLRSAATLVIITSDNLFYVKMKFPFFICEDFARVCQPGRAFDQSLNPTP